MSYNNLYLYNNLCNRQICSNTTTTPESSNNTTNNNYYNNYYNSTSKEIIKVDVGSSYRLAIKPENYNKTYELYIINGKVIYLPLLDNELYIGFTVKIVNMSETAINISSQGNQLIYSKLYLQKNGDTNMVTHINGSFTFTAVKKKGFFSWIIL
jgi:hypothetical protein